jgi:hypothetical protein
MLRLRAAVRLGRLWRSHGKAEAALQLVRAAYDAIQ